MHVEPFSIQVPDATLDDLRSRIRATRWPPAAPGEPWQLGTDLGYLQDLLHDWADSFDWRARERELNAFHHLRADLDGLAIHFVHERAGDDRGIPLVLTHGWPSTFLEYLPLVPLLTDPAAHGIEGPAFDLVIPSLPGYAFSQRAHRIGVTTREVAGLWHRLMSGLGYDRYAAGGTDFGSAVTTYLALDQPQSVIGIHLSNLDLEPWLGPGSRPLNEAEQAYAEAWEAWKATEGGYREVQATKPQTLAYALHDSPAGLAAWVVEKWRSWSDSGGQPEHRVARDTILTLLTILWTSQSMGTSMRDYYDSRWHASPLGPDDRVRVPTAVAAFERTFVPEGSVPREWAERVYEIERWTPMPRGGHFAAVEEPGLLAADIVAFFAGLPVR